MRCQLCNKENHGFDIICHLGVCCIDCWKIVSFRKHKKSQLKYLVRDAKKNWILFCKTREPFVYTHFPFVNYCYNKKRKA